MSRCSECKFFNLETEERDLSGESLRRFYEKHPNAKPNLGWGSCDLTENYFSGANEDVDTLAIAVDGSEYHAVLMVSPEFGCVMWEQRDQ